MRGIKIQLIEKMVVFMKTIPMSIFITFLVVGCGLTSNSKQQNIENISMDDLDELKQGISQKKVEKILGVQGKFQFTLYKNDNTIKCVSFSFEKYYNRYYFLFKDDSLVLVMPSIPFRTKTIPYKNARREVRIPLDPRERVRLVLNSKNYLGEDLSKFLQKQLSVERKESFNLLPAFVITAPLWCIALSDIAKDYEINNQLIKKYEPSKIKLGMSIDEVEQILGESKNIIDYNGNKTLLFGSNQKLRVNPAFLFSWVAVVFEGGKVKSIYCNDFFPPRWNFNQRLSTQPVKSKVCLKSHFCFLT